MPSITHENLVDLFRDCPALAPELLNRTGTDLPGPATPRITFAEFADLKADEYRADAVVRLDDANGNPTDIIIVEVQLDRDPQKRISWPLYMTGARARYGCPATVLVIAIDESIAAWCDQPIPLDRHQSVFHPLVLGPRQLPRITDVDQARELPELAILSASAHRHDQDAELAAAALSACHQLDSQRSARYIDFVLSSLGAAAWLALENLMSLHNYEFQSEFAKKYVEIGRDEGREEARRGVLLEQLAQRFGDVPGPVRERIEQADLEDLERWTKRVIPAGMLGDVFEDE